MKISDIFKVNTFRDQHSTDLTLSGDVSDATIKDPSLKFSKPKYVKNVNYNKMLHNVEFEDSEYDLSTIANAVQIDGLLNRSVNIFVEQINKNGYDFVVPDTKLQEHINNRLREIELFTNQKHTELINGISRQLVTYGNAYVIKSRKNSVSKYGKSYKLFNRTVQPIVGLFLADATTMKIGLNNANQVTYYKQTIAGNERIFKADDVIHLTYNKIPGLLTGRSSIVSILDDVRALRKLEEEAEILGFQYAVPLYLYKVGSDNHPAAPGEVDSVAMEINHMNTYGIMCVPHTHNIETVTNNNDPIDIIKYVEHFKKRVYSGLGLSAAVMGESDTSNRNTAEASYLSMQSITKSYQQIISDKLGLEFVKELILDAGYNPSRFEYEVRFKEIDLEATIKKETHLLQKYQGNLITLTEARLGLEMESKVDEKDLYLNKIQIPLANAEAQAQIPVIEKQGEVQIKVAKSAPKPPTSGGSSAAPKKTATASKTKSSEKSTKGKSQPSNQHGKQLSRPTFKKDFINDSKDYAKNIAKTLLNNDNYKSQLNRTTFVNKLSNNLKDTILQLTNADSTIEYQIIHKTIMLRLTDRVNRLSVIDSNEKYEYMINSIYDEILSLNTYLELNDEEE